MKLKYIFFLFVSTLTTLTSCVAKHGYEIKIASNDLKNDTVMLAHYNMGAIINNDSIVLDNNGNGVFTGKEKLPSGNYVLYLKDGNYVDVIMSDDQTFSVTLDTLRMPVNVKFKGAKETEDFYDYTIAYFDSRNEINRIISSMRSESERDSLQALITAQVDKIEKKKQDLIQKYDGKMTAVFLQGYEIPQPTENDIRIPDNCSNPDSAKAAAVYAYYRDNFLSNIDLANELSYKTPYIRQRIDTYLNKVLVQQYDSIIPQAIKLVERSTPNDSAFKIMASYMLKYATNYDLPGFLDMRHIMGIDNLIVELADRYYLNGKAFWADSALIKKLDKEAGKIRNCQIGKPAANIPLATIDNHYDSLYNYCGSVFTVVVFYEPDCEHCQERLPKIAEFYKNFKNDDRVKVVAVCMKDTKDELLKFIKEYKTDNLINVWDPERKSNYWTMFDTSETPMIYILDANKQIEAKNLEPEHLYGVAQFKLK